LSGKALLTGDNSRTASQSIKSAIRFLSPPLQLAELSVIYIANSSTNGLSDLNGRILSIGFIYNESQNGINVEKYI
jgi:hypothetical protein